MYRSAFCARSKPTRGAPRGIQLITLTSLALLGLPCHASPDTRLQVSALAASPLGDGEGRSNRLSIEPAVKWPWRNATLRAQVRMRQSHALGETRRHTDVRELSAEWSAPAWTLRVGAQQVQWGRMDLLPITDILNPLDHHDVFLEDLPQAKLALWMLNLEWQHGAHTLQGIFSPQIPVDRLRSDPHAPGVTLTTPERSLEHSTLGLRYGLAALGWNADLIAHRGWRTLPRLTPVRDAAGTLAFTGSPTPQSSLGVSADRPLGRTVLRLEAQIAREGTPPGALPAPTTSPSTVGVGLDLPWHDWFIAAQLIQQSAPAERPDTGPTHFASLIVQRKLLHDQLALRAITLHEQPGGASWNSLQARYEYSPHSTLQLQADQFTGPPDTLLGRLHKQSRLAAALIWQF